MQVLDIQAAYRAARDAGARRHRDIAENLGLREGRLIDAHVGAPTGTTEGALQARRLRANFPALLAELEPVGDLMALTRNPHCVHERTGVYERLSGSGPVGMALGEEIDLRLFYSAWRAGYAVSEGEQHSLQFFDAQGDAVHKIFLREGSRREAWFACVARWVDDSLPVPSWCPPEVKAGAPESAPDLDAFRADWAAMRDTHEFFGLLKKHGLPRTKALQAAEPRFAQPLDAHAARALLQAAAGDGTPIMVFVGNPGCIQIHSGPVQRVVVMGPWLNVLDERFNLHLREDAIAQAWAVRKPTSDGLVSSLELFDAQGELIAQFFGQRKPGKPERCAWRQLIDRMVQEPAWQSEPLGCAA